MNSYYVTVVSNLFSTAHLLEQKISDKLIYFFKEKISVQNVKKHLQNIYLFNCGRAKIFRKLFSNLNLRLKS